MLREWIIVCAMGGPQHAFLDALCHPFPLRKTKDRNTSMKIGPPKEQKRAVAHDCNPHSRFIHFVSNSQITRGVNVSAQINERSECKSQSTKKLFYWNPISIHIPSKPEKENSGSYGWSQPLQSLIIFFNYSLS